MTQITSDYLSALIYHNELAQSSFMLAAEEVMLALDEKEQTEKRRISSIQARLLATMMNYWHDYYEQTPNYPTQSQQCGSELPSKTDNTVINKGFIQ